MAARLIQCLANEKDEVRTMCVIVVLQGSCQLCQVSCLEMLSTQGRRLVSAVVAQNPSLLYPAGTERLKDIVTNYSSLTGSDKWTLQSIMLLVFRPVLANVGAMVSFNTLARGGGRRPLLLVVRTGCIEQYYTTCSY